MNIPNQSVSVVRRVAGGIPIGRGADGITAACSIGDQIACCGLVVGLGAACAAIETGVGLVACVGAIAGYVGSNCEDCACGEPLKASVCGWVGIINSIIPGTIPVPSFC